MQKGGTYKTNFPGILQGKGVQKDGTQRVIEHSVGKERSCRGTQTISHTRGASKQISRAFPFPIILAAEPGAVQLLSSGRATLQAGAFHAPWLSNEKAGRGALPRALGGAESGAGFSTAGNHNLSLPQPCGRHRCPGSPVEPAGVPREQRCRRTWHWEA